MQDENISLVKEFFRNKWVRAVLILNIVAILVVVGIYIYQSTKVSTINFNIAPIDATISVNGNTNYANGQHAVSPGTYEIKISHEGLETKTFSIDIEPHHYVSITVFLAGNNYDLSFYELMENYDSYQKLKTIASHSNNITTDHDESAQDFITTLEHRMTIFDKLPIKGYVYDDPSVNSSTAGFTIQNGQYKKGCEKITCLLVNYYGSGYEDAVKEEIKKAGYNPDDYQLFYERYQQ